MEKLCVQRSEGFPTLVYPTVGFWALFEEMRLHQQNSSGVSAVDCWLITGATGLVGRFVLAEMLRGGRLVAAMVRSRAAASAAQRIEESLAPFESEVALLRPRTIAFNLGEVGLGVSEADRSWLRSKRLGVIHSAASIRFTASSQDGEPYLSNVTGTRNLLDFLRDFNVECFHYVSTAYVSSRAVPAAELDRPRRESLVQPGCNGGNDYESSKIVSERMVCECEWLKSKTLLRPSIIVGDSKTGYTSTFHGFYAPLQIASQLTKLPGGEQLRGGPFRQQLGLRTTDSKNIVPVDWVAKAIVRIATDKNLHGGIYHLTNPQTVSCGDMQVAIERALAEVSSSSAGSPARDHVAIAEPSEQGADSSALVEGVREQLAVYETYFNCDPQFNSPNTLAALPDLPCPRVDVDQLTKLALFALKANFGWPKAQVQMPEYAQFLGTIAAHEPAVFVPGTEIIQVQVLGPGAPPPLAYAKLANRWQVADASPEVRGAGPVVILGAEDMANTAAGKATLAELSTAGKLLCLGSPNDGWSTVLQELSRDLRLT